MEIGFDYIGITTPFYCHDGKGNFLLHKRTEQCRDEKNTWDSGSGKLEFNLTIEENVQKELMEEYGCTGEIEERLPTHDCFRMVEGRKVHWLVVPFFIKVNPAEVKIGEPKKMSEIGWFKIDNFPKPLSVGFEFSFNFLKPYFEKYLEINKNKK